MNPSHSSSARTGIAPETEMLLIACGDPGGIERLDALIRRGMNWDRLIESAGRHCVLPEVYNALKNAGLGEPPPDILERLKAKYYANAARNDYLARELIAVRALLNSRAIASVAYKGPVLAQAIHGGLDRRHCGDLDLLIHEGDVLEAKNLLIANEFRPQYSMSPEVERVYLKLECEYNLERPYGNLCVELHWRFAPWHLSFPLDYERLWERLGETSLLGTSVPSLSDEDRLLVLCFHAGGKHHWNRLSQVHDVAELLRARPDLDWDQIMNQAQATGTQRILLVSLSLAGDLLGAPAPSEIRDRIEVDEEVDGLVKEVRPRLMADIAGRPKPYNRRAFYLALRERLRDRINCRLRLFYHHRRLEYHQGEVRIARPSRLGLGGQAAEKPRRISRRR